MHKDIKMVVTDLDSTLLRGDKTISAYTVDILRRLRDMGVKLVFATARPRRTVVQFLGDFATDALIVHNGAVVYVGDKVHSHHGIASDVKSQILQTISLDYPAVTLSVEIEDLNYSNFDMKLVWAYDDGVMCDFADLPNKPADKITIGVSCHEDIAKFSSYLPDDLYIQMCDGRLGLVMHKNATKWAAIQDVAAYFGIATTQAVAFGDDYNDITMLKGCGVGVAVANALDEVKAAANYICASNEDDGVAKWLDSNLLR
ncbi:MAG: HAD family hydrolase [Defluviitaleaceae bacterium]|nr:HAD family hydrolase [Defluviitaleaceae bacterium]